MTNVCKDCQERHTACWGTCPKYLEAKKEVDAIKKKRLDDVLTASAIGEAQYHGMKRCRNRKVKSKWET